MARKNLGGSSPDIDRWIRDDPESLIDKVNKKGLNFEKFKERLKNNLPNKTAFHMSDGRLKVLFNQYSIDSVSRGKLEVGKPSKVTPSKAKPSKIMPSKAKPSKRKPSKTRRLKTKPTRKVSVSFISVKTYGGTKAYKRTKPRLFSVQEQRFIKARSQKPNKVLVQEFNEMFSGTRTASSITTKKYRL